MAMILFIFYSYLPTMCFVVVIVSTFDSLRHVITVMQK